MRGSRTSGSEGGPEKPTHRKMDRALRPDPYTEHPTGDGKVYLAVVLDAFSRMVVGWSIADHVRAELVVDALQMALWRRQPRPGRTIAHSDHGAQSQYTANDYLEYCHARQLRPSVPCRTGVCWDNAIVESLWESLKRECLHGRVFATRA